MTKTISLKDGHLYIGQDGKLAMSSGLSACMQNCQTAMQTVQGEMMYNVSGGVPYQLTVWDNYRPRLFEAAARLVIGNIKDVLSIESFDQSVNDGVLEYTARIRTIYGIEVMTSAPVETPLPVLSIGGNDVMFGDDSVSFGDEMVVFGE